MQKEKVHEKDKRVGFIETEREALRTLTEKDKDEARMMLATPPIRAYIIGLVDDLVRQGIYLSQEEQAGAKMLVKIIGGELQRGAELMKLKEGKTSKAAKK